MDALTDDYPEVRHMAAAAIGEMSGRARMAIPTLIQSLKDRDESVRRRCASSPWAGSSDTPPPWCTCSDPAGSSAARAAAALGDIGSTASTAIPEHDGSITPSSDVKNRAWRLRWARSGRATIRVVEALHHDDAHMPPPRRVHARQDRSPRRRRPAAALSTTPTTSCATPPPRPCNASGPTGCDSVSLDVP